MKDTLLYMSHKRIFWFLMFITMLFMESVALGYQYILEMDPCALCVQIRAWVAGGMIISFIMMFMNIDTIKRMLGLMGFGFMMAGALHTSFFAWQVEKGYAFSMCGMDSGFPHWLRLDQWMPNLFEAKGICGDSPELLYGVTMTDGLLFILGAISLFILFQLVGLLLEVVTSK